MAWFELKAGQDPTLPQSYEPQDNPSCFGSGKICAVNADDNGSEQPDLTEELKNEMIQALHTGIPQPNVQLRSMA